MFQIENKMVKITGLNFRNETDEKGEEHGAVDIGVSAPMENDVLDHFHEELRPAFYKGDGQTDMVSGERLTVLRLPMPRFPWKGTLEDYTFVAHTGTGGPSEIKLTEADINKVHFLMKDKAAVDMEYIVRARATPEDIAKLSTLLNKEVHISLIPPAEKKTFEEQQVKKKRRQNLEDHFSGSQPAQDPDDDDQTGNLQLDGHDGDGGQDPDFREVNPPESTGQGQYQVE
jgi:hypothetical protein